LKNIEDSKAFGDLTCFNIVDKAHRDWTLCAESEDLQHSWVCKIKEVLGLKTGKYCEKKTLREISLAPTYITKKITQPVIMIPSASPQCNQGWDYAKKGTDWNCMCEEGKEQSPINLPPKDKCITSPIKPIFKFNIVEPSHESTTSSGQHKKTKTVKIKYVDNALRIRHDNIGTAVTLDGAIYKANEIVFHTPSDHQINGVQYPMEMQVVFEGQTKNDIARHVVLSFLFEKSPGHYNKFIDDLDFFSLPNPIHKSRKLLTSLHIPRIFYAAGDDDSGDIMKPFTFYTYHGSLTSPPCTERTINYVVADPIKLGSTALQLFQEAIRIPDMMNTRTGDIRVSNIPPENNRVIQRLNGRAIFYYDKIKYCGKELALRQPRPKGHYEKIPRKMIDYFYVNGPDPSGLPGSFVVSQKEALGNLAGQLS